MLRGTAQADFAGDRAAADRSGSQPYAQLFGTIQDSAKGQDGTLRRFPEARGEKTVLILSKT